MPREKTCGCKGIRTCLLCEKQSDISCKSVKTEKDQYSYNYCPYCNLCWPNDEATASQYDFPLYLGKIKIVHEFCSKEEESTIISFMDKIPWIPSQSGRQKQDFGPKVNFKKKKVKIGEFQGFPKFAENVIQKFQDFPELSDFDPVELCNLEYTPERGSSIDPHVDDFWLWGERLVTVNLSSTSILTLVPCSEVSCKCHLAANSLSFFQPTGKHSNETNMCKHLFQNGDPIKRSSKCLSENDTTASKFSSLDCELLKNDLQNLELSERIECSEICNTSDNGIRPVNSFEVSETNLNEIIKNNHDRRTDADKKIHSEIKATSSNDYKNTVGKINSICSLFRTCSDGFKLSVRIVLPPRSLFILSGCARYNWFHEIKRQDIISRRLAMTFRELSSEFLHEGKESQCGKDLLLIAKHFYDL